ncbi:MAG: site-specific integrase [Xanthobacteraceae bacterium]
MKLSARTTAGLKLPTGKTDHIVFDDAVPGFGLRLREGGGRSWVYQYALGTKQRRIMIGKATAMTADKAREIAEVLHAKVRLGGDPAGEKALSIATAARSFKAIVDQFLAHQRRQLRPRSFVEVERHLLSHAKPLHGLPIATIDHQTIAARLTDIATKSGPIAANRVRATMCAMWTWAMKQGLAGSNPASLTNKQTERSRDRVLDDHEIATVWRALDSHDDFSNIMKLLILTGCRANEIAGLRWSEVDFEKGEITLPAERVKNGRVHVIPMPGTMAAILGARTRIEGRDLVFGRGNGPFSGWSKSKAQLDERIAEPMPEWTIHDLRRSFVSGLARIGVDLPVIEKLVNHSSGSFAGVVGIYQRHSFAAEKATALARWDEHIASVVDGRPSKIATLKREARS